MSSFGTHAHPAAPNPTSHRSLNARGETIRTGTSQHGKEVVMGLKGNSPQQAHEPFLMTQLIEKL
jgi:hypothetical protein